MKVPSGEHGGRYSDRLLGADLAELSKPGGILAIQGNVAMMVAIQWREERLVGKQAFLIDEVASGARSGDGRRVGRARLKAVRARKAVLFDPEPDVPNDPNQPFIPGLEPPRLESLAIQPERAQVKPGAHIAFQVKGLDQHGRPMSVPQTAWNAKGGKIDNNGGFTAGMDEGEFLIDVCAGHRR